MTYLTGRGVYNINGLYNRTRVWSATDEGPTVLGEKTTVHLSLIWDPTAGALEDSAEVPMHALSQIVCKKAILGRQVMHLPCGGRRAGAHVDRRVFGGRPGESRAVMDNPYKFARITPLLHRQTGVVLLIWVGRCAF